MTKLLESLIDTPAYLSVALAISLVSMLSSFLMILVRSRAKLKISNLLKIIFTSSIAIILIIIFYNNQQVKKAKESISVLRDSDVVKITSSSQFLKSAKFQILAENKDDMFIEDDDAIYKVSKKELTGDTK